MPKRTAFSDRATYEITVGGSLDPERSAWFNGLSIVQKKGNETVLSGPVADQAALHGLLARIRDLGLTLLTVRRIEREE